MAAQPSAKIAIHAFCNALQLLGLPSLPPESVRQAKFASGDPEKLWRALHDYVVLQLSGPTSAPAILRFWVDLAQEQLDEASGLLASEGKDMVVHQLMAWGCPPELLRQLAKPDTASTRHLLLALVWLAAKHDLFPLALRQLAMPPDMLLLLPPCPEDARACMATHQTYMVATTSASSHTSSVIRHVTHLQQQAIDLATPPHRLALGSGANRLQPTLSKSEVAQLDQQQQELAPNADAVARMWQAVEAGAQCTITMIGKVRAAMLSLQSHMDAVARLNHEVRSVQSTAWPRGQLWSAFELRLLTQPGLLRQHTQALESATAALQQQLQLVTGANMFFKWAGSVVAEEAAAVAQTVGRQQHSTAAPQSQAAGPLKTLAALPEAGSSAATALLQRLQSQLTAALRAIPPSAAVNSAQTPLSVGGITKEHFMQLAKSAVPAHEKSVFNGATVNEEPKQAYHDLAQDTAWALPHDIQNKLSGMQAATEAAQAQQQGWVRQQLFQRLGSACVCSTALPPAPAFGTAPPVKGLASGRPAAGPSETPDAASETSRLVETTLTVARSLAQIRGTHRQLLQETADSMPDRYLVVGL